MKPWNEILLQPDDSLETAIQVLHSGGNRIALVIDENERLLGTVTDGDIRRAILQHVTMTAPVTEVMNEHPTIASTQDQRHEIMALMKSRDLLHIPVVDPHGVLVGLEKLQHLIENPEYDNPVFLMAGGFGTRLRPLTDNTPKPLLEVGGRPILETILGRFIEAGFHNFYISTHYKAEMIREHFGDGSAWGVTIRYVHEEKPLGTAGGLSLLPKNLPELPILMMNGDLLTNINFEFLLDFHQHQKGVATMCVREYDFQVPYGVVQIEKHLVTDIVEKPVHKFFVNAGIYVLDPELVKGVGGGGYLDMPMLLEKQIEAGKRVNSFPIHEYWLDIGRMSEYESAHENYNREF